MFGRNKEVDKLDLERVQDEWFVEVEEKKKPKFTRFLAFAGGVMVASLFTSMLIPPALLASAGVNTAYGMWDELSSDLKVDDAYLPQKTVLLDRNGKKFAQYYSENRENISLAKISKDFQHGIVATEDSRFYTTSGFDPIGMARSVVSNSSGGGRQGASGLVQQLVKNLLILNAKDKEALALVQERSVKTKLQELKYAVGLNEKYSKDQLLEMYSNSVYFGNRAYGIKAASRTYFDTTPDKLDLNQSAMLAGIVNSPTAYDPFLHPEAALNRKNKVLSRMLAEGKITRAEYTKNSKIKVNPKRGATPNGCSQSDYPYYCVMVQQELLANKAFGDTAKERETFYYQGGLTIKTALDPQAMKISQKQVDRAWGKKNRVKSAVAIIQPGTGQIQAVAQNTKWGTKKGQTQVVYAKSERQVGSSFKPFTLATAYEQGLQPDKLVLNSNSFYKPRGWDYPKPRGFSNFGYYNYGAVNGADATRQSLNVYFVRLMQKTGVVPVAELTNRIGLSVPTNSETNKTREATVHPKSLSLTLGAWGASPIEMANAYSTFASGGVKCNALSIMSAKRTDSGESIKVSDPECHQALMPNIANNMNKILRNPFKDGGTLKDYRLKDGRVSAGKTGTSNNKGDAWTVGYTPQISTAVWSGDPRGASNYPLSSYTQYGYYRAGSTAGTGGPTSGPIWEDVMNDVMKGKPKLGFASPSNDVNAAIKSTSIPDVQGLSVNSAITTLQAYGYKPVISKDTSGDKMIQKNTVVTQTPRGGNNGSFGQEITLVLSPGSDVNIVIAEKKNED